MIKKSLLLTIALSAMLSVSSSVYGFSQSSTNYKLEGDFNIFSGSKSSANYNLTDTGGGLGTGFSSSGSYKGCFGFQCTAAKVPTITFSISTNSLNLGSLSASLVSTNSHTITVSSILTRGYQVTVYEDGNLRSGSNDINDVSGGTVDAGSEEYGLATSKAGQQIIQDTSCGPDPDNASPITGSPQTVASSTVDVTNDQTTLCYSASISNTTPAGVYQHMVVYIATGTF